MPKTKYFTPKTSIKDQTTYIYWPLTYKFNDFQVYDCVL